MRCVDLYNQAQSKWFEEMVTTTLVCGQRGQRGVKMPVQGGPRQGWWAQRDGGDHRGVIRSVPRLESRLHPGSVCAFKGLDKGQHCCTQLRLCTEGLLSNRQCPEQTLKVNVHPTPVHAHRRVAGRHMCRCWAGERHGVSPKQRTPKMLHGELRYKGQRLLVGQTCLGRKV